MRSKKKKRSQYTATLLQNLRKPQPHTNEAMHCTPRPYSKHQIDELFTMGRRPLGPQTKGDSVLFTLGHISNPLKHPQAQRARRTIASMLSGRPTVTAFLYNLRTKAISAGAAARIMSATDGPVGQTELTCALLSPVVALTPPPPPPAPGAAVTVSLLAAMAVPWSVTITMKRIMSATDGPVERTELTCALLSPAPPVVALLPPPPAPGAAVTVSLL